MTKYLQKTTNLTKYMSEISKDVILSEKTSPAGMPTHHTGVDNIKNPLQLIKIHSNQLKSININ